MRKLFLGFIAVMLIIAACTKESEVDITTLAETPKSLIGKSVKLIYTLDSGAFYSLNDTVNFTFLITNDVLVDIDPRKGNGNDYMLNELHRVNGEYRWNDNRNNYTYSFLIQADTITSINILDKTSGDLIGQFDYHFDDSSTGGSTGANSLIFTGGDTNKIKSLTFNPTMGVKNGSEFTWVDNADTTRTMLIELWDNAQRFRILYKDSMTIDYNNWLQGSGVVWSSSNKTFTFNNAIIEAYNSENHLHMLGQLSYE